MSHCKQNKYLSEGSIYIHMYSRYVSAKGMCHWTYQCFREEVELVHPGLDGSHVPRACYGGDIYLWENGRSVYMHRDDDDCVGRKTFSKMNRIHLIPSQSSLFPPLFPSPLSSFAPCSPDCHPATLVCRLFHPGWTHPLRLNAYSTKLTQNASDECSGGLRLVRNTSLLVLCVSIFGCGFRIKTKPTFFSLLLHHHNYLILHLFHLGLEHRHHSIRRKSLLQLVHRHGTL